MKIKRFMAHDMRQAMQMVRESQGPDAVILSSRRIDGGIEIVAAIDYDEALVREAVSQLHSPTAALQEPPTEAAAIAIEAKAKASAIGNITPAASSAPTARREAIIKAWPKTAAAPALATAEENVADFISAQFTEERMETDLAAAIASEDNDSALSDLAEQPGLSGVHNELNQLRQILESQMSSLAWNDLGRRQPGRARVLRELARYAIEPDIAAEIAERLPNNQPITDQSGHLTLGLMAKRLTGNISANDFLDRAGFVAFVGPTGVGKTTTIAKLAARYVLRHGREKLALISADGFRIGAQDQLLRYGRLLGVPVYTASDAKEIDALLNNFSDSHTVLIDTPGMGFRDTQLSCVIDTLNKSALNIRHTLVLAANAQVCALDEAARAYAELKPTGCILTKLDEAPMLGGALSIVMRHKLMLDFVTYGQKVPEDIVLADARRLICRLTNAQNAQAQPDELQMAERFGHAALAYA